MYATYVTYLLFLFNWGSIMDQEHQPSPQPEKSSRALTKDQIFAAADALAAVGERVTLDAVRLHLKKTVGRGGSYTLLSPTIQEWESAQKSAREPIRIEVPPQVTDALQAVGVTVMTVAVDLANARLQSARDALDAERLQFEARNAAVAEAADRLDAQLDEALQALAQRDADLVKLTADLQGARVDIGRMQSDLDAARRDIDSAKRAAAGERERASAAEQLAAQMRGIFQGLQLDNQLPAHLAAQPGKAGKTKSR
jgi:colicin import membrane protein